jgi:molybdopterin converting factor small subunit
MARLKVIFFGELKRLGAGKGEIELPEPACVADVARAVGIGDGASALAVVNGKTALSDAPVGDGDEVAFFPRVAGGAA